MWKVIVRIITFAKIAKNLLIHYSGLTEGVTMDQELLSKIRGALIEHEGYKKEIYIDTVGKVTGGIGYNLTDRGLPDWFIDKQFIDDAQEHYNALSRDFKWFDQLSDNRKVAMIDMCFMGYKRFLEFKKMLEAMNVRCYESAALEIYNSCWAKEVQQKRRDDVINWVLHG